MTTSKKNVHLAMYEVLPAKDKATIENYVCQCQQEGKGLKQIRKDIGNALRNLKKQVGSAVLKEIIVPVVIGKLKEKTGLTGEINVQGDGANYHGLRLDDIEDLQGVEPISLTRSSTSKPKSQKSKRKPRFAKGSPEAKEYMANLRAKRVQKQLNEVAQSVK